MSDDERDGDDLDREVADLEGSASKVQDGIEKTRSDWEAKKDDPSVPGAAADPDDEPESDDKPDDSESDADNSD